MSRKALFDAVRLFAPEHKFSAKAIELTDLLADEFGFPRDSAAPVNGAKQTGPKGLALIKSFEGLRLDAYPDPGTGAEPITIGYGHTGGVKLGARITEAQAEAFLREDLRRFERAVIRLAPKTTQNQFDALVAFSFNVGEGALGGSTLLKLHNAGKYAEAKAQFARWNKAAGRVMNGLTRRRAAEAELYGS